LAGSARRVGDIKAIISPGRGRRAPTAGWLAPREPPERIVDPPAGPVIRDDLAPATAGQSRRVLPLVLEKVVYAPIWELAFLNGVGPRVGESGLGLISGHAYSAPYEDVTLKGK
jgi:hypothetical protein